MACLNPNTHTHMHTEHTHTHTQISTVASAHTDLHTDAFIHTRVALRQRTPCLTTTTDLVKQWEEGKAGDGGDGGDGESRELQGREG